MPVQNIEHRLALEPIIQCALFIGQEGLAGGFATPSRKLRRSNIGHSVSCSPHRHPVCAHRLEKRTQKNQTNSAEDEKM